MTINDQSAKNEAWPSLPMSAWQDTYATLHMWTQIIGKIRLAQTPLINHWWNVPLYVSARGLNTSLIPYQNIAFEMEFDFIEHQLLIHCNDGRKATIGLYPRSVADFYQEVMQRLQELHLAIKIWPTPVEVADPIPFDQDQQDSVYQPEFANRCWRILVSTKKVFEEFRACFIGKCSPVHFFWSSFDLVVSRFSGRRAPKRPEANVISQEAYSHEVISHGFWPGMRISDTTAESASVDIINQPAFYSYTAPEPAKLNSATIRPNQAFYNTTLKEFILLYDDMRNADSPETMLMEFLQSTYEAGARLAKWNRSSLERTMSTIC